MFASKARVDSGNRPVSDIENDNTVGFGFPVLKSVLVILGLLLALLQYRLWFGDGNIPQMLEYERRVDTLNQEAARLARRNESLAAEVLNLRNSDDAIEERAREDLGMVKDGEIYFQVIEPSAKSN